MGADISCTESCPTTWLSAAAPWCSPERVYTPAAGSRTTGVHPAVARLEKAGKLRAVVTQNIDGLHRKAGTSLDLLVELHGTMDAVECRTCLDRYEPDPWFRRFADTGRPPRCRCGGFLKPATISFGQSIRSEDLERAFAAADVPLRAEGG